jgi:hypothetical protein
MRDGPAIDLHPLGIIQQVGGGVQADTVAGRLQGTGDHDRNGALSFRAGDMDNRVIAVWIAQNLHEGEHASQVKFFRGVTQITHQAVIHKFIKIIQSLLVGWFDVHMAGIVTV